MREETLMKFMLFIFLSLSVLPFFSHATSKSLDLSTNKISDIYREPSTIYSCTSGIRPHELSLVNLFFLNDGRQIIEITEVLQSGSTEYFNFSRRLSHINGVIEYEIEGSKYNRFQHQIESELSNIQLFSDALKITVFYNCVLQN